MSGARLPRAGSQPSAASRQAAAEQAVRAAARVSIAVVCVAAIVILLVVYVVTAILPWNRAFARLVMSEIHSVVAMIAHEPGEHGPE